MNKLAMSCISFVWLVVLEMPVFAQYPGEPKTKTVEVAKNQFITKKYCAASKTKCECSKEQSQYTEGNPQQGCVQMVVAMGRPRYSALTDSISLQLNELEPTSRLYSPDGFSVVAGYTISRVTRDKNAGGVPKWVRIITMEGVPSEFVFEDGEVVGKPLPGMHQQAAARLAMVDVQGWSTATDPAYYDYYPGDGSRWRFGAAQSAPDYLQFVEHQTPSWRVEKKQDLGLEIMRDAEGLLRQVVTPARLADFVARGQDAYDLAIYPNDSSCFSGARTADGFYEIVSGAVPEVVWKFRNPTPGAYGVLEVTREKAGAEPQIWRYVYVDAVKDFTLSYPGGTVSEHSERFESDDGSTMVVRKYKANAEGVASSKAEQYFEMQAGSYVIVRSVRDPDGLKLTRSYEYYKDAPFVGLDSLSVSENGSWVSFEYDNGKRVVAEIRPWLDAPTNAPPTQCAITRYGYNLFVPGDFLRFNDQRPRVVVNEICGDEVSRTYHAYPTNAVGQAQEIEERAAFSAAPYGHASNPRTVKTYYAPSAAVPLAGRLATVVYPGGKTESYGYEYGTFNAATFAFAADPDGGAWRETVTTEYTDDGREVSPKPSHVQATCSVRVWDEKGREVLNESYVEDRATFALIGWTRLSYDRNGKLVEIAYSDGRVESTTWGANCCGKESETSAEGLITLYGYNELKKKVSETKKGLAADSSDDITTLYTYDLEGRVLSTAVTNIASGFGYVASRSAYDAVGRVTNTSDRLGNATVTSYASDGAVTVSRPNGVVAITDNYLDGQVKRLLENGVVKQSYAYGVLDPEGVRWSLLAQGSLPEVQSLASFADLQTFVRGLDFPWSFTVSDSLGRTVLQGKPGFGQTVLVTSNAYDIAGNLLSASQYSVSSLLTSPTLYAYDAVGNRVLTALDVNTNGVIDLSGPDRVTGLSTTYEKDASNIWWSVSRSWVYPEFNSVCPVTTSVQRVCLTGLCVTWATSPMYNKAWAVSPSTLLSALSESLDLRGNATVSATLIDRAGKIVTQLSITSTSAEPSIQTKVNGLLTSVVSVTFVTNSYAYNSLAQRIAVTDGRGNTTITAYNPVGQTVYIEDAASCRTSFVYDSLGRRTEVTDALGNVTHTAYDAEGRVTKTWGATYPVEYEYDVQGRMVSMKTFRDENGGEDVTCWLYDQPTGLLTNKLYADGLGPAYTYTADGKLASRLWTRGILTSYAYDETGALTGVDYSDATPDVGYTYDRLGNQLSASNSISTNLFAYSPETLELIQETQNGTAITRSTDANGRSAGLSMGDKFAVTYGYDDLGRFFSVSSAVESVSSVVRYSYLSGSNLLTGYKAASSVSSFQLQVYKTYEPHRDLIVSISNHVNHVNSFLISAYDYTNDALGRRVYRHDSGFAFAQSQTNSFGYNQLSEVTSAVMYTNAYGYLYGPIGNRLFSSANAETNSYFSNSVNQYSNITYQSTAFSLKPSYDSDGNMTTTGDGWHYIWNGENHLVLASNAQHIVSYAYDHKGRMVSKSVDGSSRSYLWDGYNIVSEKLTNSGTNELLNFYTWGLDLSGTLQGAGSVGGLLAVHTLATADVQLPAIHFPAYDANGNIMEYTASDGSIAAHREYDAFGNTISEALTSGTNESNFAFTFWWSTKPWCEITGVSEYELRKYDPKYGRWLNRDPKTEHGFDLLRRFSSRSDYEEDHSGLAYVFVFNNAINRYDILGLDCPGCDMVGGAIPGLFDKPCSRRCCAKHDECYRNKDCTAWSWGYIVAKIAACIAAGIPPGLCLGIPVSPCDFCNVNVVRCLGGCAIDIDPGGEEYYCPRQGRYIGSIPGEFYTVGDANQCCCN